MAKLGVIGGSGLYDLDQMANPRQEMLDTPFGRPSDVVISGEINGREIVFLPRHGIGHRLTPSEVPYRANIHAMKQMGVTHLLSISAVGSLTERFPPLSLVCPDQIIDRTVCRERSFFGNGIVAHVGMADPFCAAFTDLIVDRATQAGVSVERGGTYLCVEGPQFSTRAESALYRSWGASVIGMTAMPEARLAREAELCYVQIAMVTDFDVWHESEAPVTVERVIKNLRANSANAKRVLLSLVSGDLSGRESCGCPTALANAIVTDPDALPGSRREQLSVIAGPYLAR